MSPMPHLRRLLAGVAVCVALTMGLPAVASAETVAFVCVPYRPGTFGQHAAFTVVVNYNEKTAKNVFGSSADWLPAEITERAIKWTNLIRYPDGNSLKDYWTMERSSGLLTRANAGTAHCVKQAQPLQQARK